MTAGPEKMIPSSDADDGRRPLSPPLSSSAQKAPTPPLHQERGGIEGALHSFAKSSLSTLSLSGAFGCSSHGRNGISDASPSEIESQPTTMAMEGGDFQPMGSLPTMMEDDLTPPPPPHRRAQSDGLCSTSTAGSSTKARAEALTTAALYQQHVELDWDRALHLHRSALALYRSAADANANAVEEEADGATSGGGAAAINERPRVPVETYDVETAITLTDIGDVHRRRGEASEAMGSYREALGIFRTICLSSSNSSGGESSRNRSRAVVSANHPGVKAAERGVKLLEQGMI